MHSASQNAFLRTLQRQRTSGLLQVIVAVWYRWKTGATAASSPSNVLRARKVTEGSRAHSSEGDVYALEPS